MLLLFVEIPVRGEHLSGPQGQLLNVNLPNTLIIQLLAVAASAGRRAGYPGFSGIFITLIPLIS